MTGAGVGAGWTALGGSKSARSPWWLPLGIPEAKPATVTPLVLLTRSTRGGEGLRVSWLGRAVDGSMISLPARRGLPGLCCSAGGASVGVSFDLPNRPEKELKGDDFGFLSASSDMEDSC